MKDKCFALALIALLPTLVRAEVAPPGAPPTELEAAISDLGATPDRYLFDYYMLPMRDGTRLATVVVRPKAAGRYPVILERTPYVPQGLTPHYSGFLDDDYAVVIQNERGSNLSEGEFGFLHKTAQDARDTLDWIEAQPWSNGRVGAEGCSSSAENQLMLGARGHRALKAMIAGSAAAGVGSIPGVDAQGLAYKGGIPNIVLWSMWFSPFGNLHRPQLPKGLDPAEQMAALRNFSVLARDHRDKRYDDARSKSQRTAPSIDVLKRIGASPTEYESRLRVAPTDPTWSKPDLITAADRGATPTLNINGWADIGPYETVKLFEFQQRHPDQYLIMAPTRHCAMTQTSPHATVGDRPVGDTTYPYPELFKSWFDRFLKEDPAAWKPMPKVQVFLMGANQWLTGDRWPLPDTEISRLYLAGGAARSLFGDGRLDARAGDGGKNVLIADPANPVPSVEDIFRAPVKDRRSIESRHDVLVYSTPRLEKGLTIAGDISATLYVRSDVKDTDLIVKLVDVYPDGAAYTVQTGALRLRYRNGVDKPALMQPGQLYKVTVGGMVTANYFAPGHRMRLEISGSDFPNLDRNWNTGGRNETETQGPVAHLEIHHGGAQASYVEFRKYNGAIKEIRPE